MESNEYLADECVELLNASSTWVKAKVIGVSTKGGGWHNLRVVTGYQLADAHGLMYWHSVVSAQTHVRRAKPTIEPKIDGPDWEASYRLLAPSHNALAERVRQLELDLDVQRKCAEARTAVIDEQKNAIENLQVLYEDRRNAALILGEAHKNVAKLATDLELAQQRLVEAQRANDLLRDLLRRERAKTSEVTAVVTSGDLVPDHQG